MTKQDTLDSTSKNIHYQSRLFFTVINQSQRKMLFLKVAVETGLKIWKNLASRPTGSPVVTIYNKMLITRMSNDNKGMATRTN